MSTATPSRFYFNQIDRRTKQITPALVTAVTAKIVQHLQPMKVILFGSQASNRAAPSSDLDVLVILDDSHPLASLKRRDRLGKLLDLFPYRLFGLDAIMLTNAEIQTLQETNEGEWDLVLDILAEGKVLYERSQETPTE